MYDVIIIGAGVSGCAIARELSRYQVKACVLEREEDVCCGTSKANSAIVHAGYDAMPGTLMAKLNVIGNELMGTISSDLSVPFERTGSFVACMSKDEYPQLEALYERGIQNGVKELRILNQEEVRTMEPNLSDQVYAALYAPTAGIICPFELTFAFAENSNQNGVEYFFQTEVQSIEQKDQLFHIHTNQGEYISKTIVNAAGVYADVLHNMVSQESLNITPRRGEYCLFDRSSADQVSRTIFTLPSKLGKGVLVTKTVHGNLLIGPTSHDVLDKEDTETTREGLDEVIMKAKQIVPNLAMNQIITSFAGLRAHEDRHDFIIGEVSDCQGFFDVAGIESPGIASAPAIGVMVSDMLRDKLDLVEKENYITTRKGILNPNLLSIKERNELIAKNPAYGNIICRCETISEGEMLEAIHRPLGAKSLDGIKRRVRAGMGRCQGGFCSPRVTELLARELHVDMIDITKSGKGSNYIYHATKG